MVRSGVLSQATLRGKHLSAHQILAPRRDPLRENRLNLPRFLNTRVLNLLHPTPINQRALVMDNACYRPSRLVIEMADALDMELLGLPAYSLNLNLIERVWRLVKARCLRNIYFPNFRVFTGSLDEFLDSIS
jgi:hypothetical protein